MEIYQPSDDSYLLAEEVKKYLILVLNKNRDKNKNITQDFKILDMGSGSGIQAETCKRTGFDNIICADINPYAVDHLKKQGFKAVKTDLFLDLNPKTKFDLIIFNAPYLPEDKREPKDSRPNTTAGEQGYEIINAFLEQAKPRLNPNAIILLLFSSLSQPRIIINKAKELGYNKKLLSSKRLFFEELYVYEFKL
ncbi:MAG: HemK2/MTQ2 family protein methyltransferase [Candidatus Pacearchaeota archaeon]|jgi:release factor glutamine methyltransferase